MYHISNDKRSYESSKMIYNALKTLILEKDYDKIKINELCERAKIGRVTFYRHYDTISDVLQKQFDDDLNNIKNIIDDMLINDSVNIGIFKPILRYFYVNPTIIKLILKANQTQIIKESMSKFFESIDSNITNEYLTAIRTSIFVGIIEKWSLDDMNITPDELIANIRSDMLNILMNRIK